MHALPRVFGHNAQVPMSHTRALEVASHGLTMPLFGIGESAGLNSVNLNFPELVKTLRDRSFEQPRKRAIQDRTDIGRTKACALFIDGLYQAYCSNVPDAAVAFPLSPRNYGTSKPFVIKSHTYENIRAAYEALISLGWVTHSKGYKRPDDYSQPTSVAPTGYLLECFKSSKPRWRRSIFTADPIIVRDKKKKSKQHQKIVPPDTSQVHLAREQLHQINQLLGDQAICLALPNSGLKKLALEMAGSQYSYAVGSGSRVSRARLLNFAQVGLRRIFAKGCMDRGGRMYGAWWQTIPKDYRRFVTINGRPTVEVDFSEIHPTMLYCLAGQAAPPNIYDLGIRNPGEPPYDPKVEPHKSRRKIIKTFVCALINDERGVYRLTDLDAMELGMSHEQLKKAVMEKHPVIAQSFRTDIGLYLQFLDSQIAAGVMVRLMEQRIVALPVHDSFLVQEEFEPELITAMRQEFAAVMQTDAQLKETELPIDAFAELGRDGNLSRIADAHKDAFHDEYVLSWQQQHQSPAHTNLSRFPPFRFPDGELT